MIDPPTSTMPQAQRCPLCGGSNRCMPAHTGSLAGDCWCRTARIAPAVLARVAAEQWMKACLCPACAAGAGTASAALER